MRGASGDRVPAYLLIPPGGGPFPAIIWGHWLKKGSPLANKDEFLEEAVALAHSGVVSLLIDAPQARNEWVEAKSDAGPLEAAKQQSEAAVHQVTDLRRGIDLLYGRPDVDRKRIAYVGHSWDAHVGAILAGVETRISAYVLMASGYSDEEETFASKDPQTMAHIKEVGEDNVREYFREYAWDDPVYFLGHTDRESIFLQFASGDPITKETAQKYLDRFSSKDKKMEFYDAPHALNAAARLDRDRWLQKHLGIKKIDEKELEGYSAVEIAFFRNPLTAKRHEGTLRTTNRRIAAASPAEDPEPATPADRRDARDQRIYNHAPKHFWGIFHVLLASSAGCRRSRNRRNRSHVPRFAIRPFGAFAGMACNRDSSAEESARSGLTDPEHFS